MTCSMILDPSPFHSLNAMTTAPIMARRPSTISNFFVVSVSGKRRRRRDMLLLYEAGNSIQSVLLRVVVWTRFVESCMFVVSILSSRVVVVVESSLVVVSGRSVGSDRGCGCRRVVDTGDSLLLLLLLLLDVVVVVMDDMCNNSSGEEDRVNVVVGTITTEKASTVTQR